MELQNNLPDPAQAPEEVNPIIESAEPQNPEDTLTREAELEAESTQMPDEDAAADALVKVEEAQPVTRAALLERLKVLAENDASDISNDELARLKMQFYQVKNEEPAEPSEDGITIDNSVEEEESFKALMAAIKEKKAEQRRLDDERRQANLERKRAIIAQLTEMAEDTDNVNRHFNQARDLQNEFLAIGDVPDTETTALWKDYQDARERFYDQLKINKELRDYDFKKNLAEKELLCDEAAKLASSEEEDIVTAFRRLQDLHDKWRRIGPVAKELREELWTRFKDASAIINKKYQAHFEERKAREAENEAAKTALCLEIEALDWKELKTFAAWDAMTRTIIDAQTRWKSLGFASRRTNNLLFNRFRSVCDAFFADKAAFFKSMKEGLAANLAAKMRLAERAEALKDSTDWRTTADEMVALQKEWKTIGAVPKKQSDAIWQRFMAACDYFFDQKKQNNSGVRHTEQANLRLKQEIIDRLAAVSAPDAPMMERQEAIALLNDLRNQWNEIGHVPFRVKDKIYDNYRQLLRDAENKFDIRRTRARNEQWQEAVREMEGDNGKIMRERERIARTLEQRRSELNTYENNLGFLSFKSDNKSGKENPLMKEMQRRVQHIKDDIEALELKIRTLDSKITD